MAHVTLVCNTDDEYIIITTTQQQLNLNAIHVRIINTYLNKTIEGYVINKDELVKFAHLIIEQYVSE